MFDCNKSVGSNIAVVGFGGAGTNIIAKIVKNIKDRDDIMLYYVNDEMRLKNVIFYEYSERRELVKELSDYNWVIMTARLGGGGGDSLVYVANKLNNAYSAFVVFPFSVERSRIREAIRQLSSLDKTRVFVIRLDVLRKTVPYLRLDLALSLVDWAVVAGILNLVGGIVYA